MLVSKWFTELRRGRWEWPVIDEKEVFVVDADGRELTSAELALLAAGMVVIATLGHVGGTMVFGK